MLKDKVVIITGASWFLSRKGYQIDAEHSCIKLHLDL
jgi:hypothetical protein